MRILSISDVHIETNNYKRIINELSLLKESLKEKKPDILAIVGDFFDCTLPFNSNAVLESIKYFKEIAEITKSLNIEFRLIKGTKTHDQNQLLNIAEALKDFSNFEYYHSFGYEVINKAKVLFLPEEYPENYLEYYKDVLDKKFDIIFFHGTIKSKAWKNQIMVSERPYPGHVVWDDEVLKKMSKNKYCPIICGHIHTHSFIEPNIFYNGSFSRGNHGENENKGFLYLETNFKNYLNYELIVNELAPKYTNINLDLEEEVDFLKIKDKVEKNLEVFNFISIDCSEDFKEKNKEVLENLKNVFSQNKKISFSTFGRFSRKYKELLESDSTKVLENLSSYKKVLSEDPFIQELENNKHDLTKMIQIFAEKKKNKELTIDEIKSWIDVS
jgi:UDP-2,3-diacylglucosamine pyrophosphatase LpxH